MKVTKTFTIDVEILQKLQEINASDLINRLLHNYFNDSNNLGEIENQEEELKTKIKSLEEQKKEIESKQAREKRIAAININPQVKEWLLKLQQKPTILQINEYLKAYKIEKKTGDLELYLKAYDNLQERST